MANLLESTTSVKLTTTQKQRYDYLYPIYGDLSDQIVRSMTGKGRNSWQSFLDKMEIARKAKTWQQEYYDALYEQFPIGEIFTPSQVLGGVGEVRRALELDPFVDKLQVRAEKDFFLAYIAREDYSTVMEDGKEKKVLNGYIPLIKIKAE